MSLMPKNPKLLNKILTNWIQERIKKILSHDQIGFISGMQGWFDVHKWINIIQHCKQTWQKSHNHLKFKKAFNDTQHPFMIKILKKLGTWGTCLNIMKAIVNKSTANIALSGKRPKAFPLKSETRDMYVHCNSDMVLES